jgi:hypothetical protein
MKLIRFFVTGLSGIALGVSLTMTGIHRFQRPELTETQLLLNCWTEYLILAISGFTLGWSFTGAAKNASKKE